MELWGRWGVCLPVGEYGYPWSYHVFFLVVFNYTTRQARGKVWILGSIVRPLVRPRSRRSLATKGRHSISDRHSSRFLSQMGRPEIGSCPMTPIFCRGGDFLQSSWWRRCCPAEGVNVSFCWLGYPQINISPCSGASVPKCSTPTLAVLVISWEWGTWDTHISVDAAAEVLRGWDRFRWAGSAEWRDLCLQAEGPPPKLRLTDACLAGWMVEWSVFWSVDWNLLCFLYTLYTHQCWCLVWMGLLYKQDSCLSQAAQMLLFGAFLLSQWSH